MAHYLIAKKTDDFWHVLAEVSADSLRQAIESVELENGEAVKVYRIASGPKTVSVQEVRELKMVVE